MAKLNIHIDVSINFYNEYFTGGGKGISSIDSYSLKGINGLPYIPGSALKGKLRYITTGLYSSLTKYKCIFYYGEDKKCECIMCKMFGCKENSKGQLNFQNLNLNNYNQLEKDSSNLFNNRDGILINRFMKVAKDSSLFNYETASVGGNFYTGEIDGYLDEETYKGQLLLLYLGFNMMDTLGGFQSRGIGWIGDKKEIDIYVDKKKVTEEMFEEWRGELEV